ncbi:hypothetical protein AAVH_38428 [Aphelenchoides avenae]|nr:hypothetical protein AAVH_38428 [Aphelenchus avenae]
MYLVIHEQLDLRSAYNTVKNARSIIHPNRGFRAQMIAYTKQKSGRLLEDEDAYVFRRSRARSPSRYRGAKRARRAPPVDPEKMNKVLELVFMAYKQISLQPDAGAATQRSVEQN